MAELFTLQNLIDLGVLIFLQAVLGFDNLLYISIESKRAPEEKQKAVRRNGILVAIALRIALLFAVIKLIDVFSQPFFEVHWTGVIEGAFNFATLVFLLGGGFIMYTAVKEIGHMLSIEEPGHAHRDKGESSVIKIVFLIAVMNLVFSFDSILSALAISKLFAILALAVVISGVLMLVMSNVVADFLKRNRKYEVLGLFILLIVGVVLLGEGGHESHLHVFGYAIEPMSKSTFYFSIAVLVVVDILQSRYQKKLSAERQRAHACAEAARTPEREA